MNPLHLLWIVPLSATFGYGVAVLLMVGKTLPPASEILGARGTVQGDLNSRSEAKNEIFEKVSKFPDYMRQ